MSKRQQDILGIIIIAVLGLPMLAVFIYGTVLMSVCGGPNVVCN